jgi:hypothetical protein
MTKALERGEKSSMETGLNTVQGATRAYGQPLHHLVARTSARLKARVRPRAFTAGGADECNYLYLAVMKSCQSIGIVAPSQVWASRREGQA